MLAKGSGRSPLALTYWVYFGLLSTAKFIRLKIAFVSTAAQTSISPGLRDSLAGYIRR